MWKRIQRFSALERRQRALFMRASVLLPLISMSLRWRGFRKTKALLQRFLSVPYRPKISDPRKDARLTTEMVRAAGLHGIGHPSCLETSLTLWWLLARHGIASELRVGVRKEGEKFEAHAWVECEGEVLNDPESNHLHYLAFDAALASLPPKP